MKLNTKNNPVGVMIMLLLIVACVVMFIMAMVSCTPTKSTLKQKINEQSAVIDVLYGNSERQSLLLQNVEKQRDSVSLKLTNYELRLTNLQNENKSLLEKTLTNLWYKDYYESGQLKSEGGTNTEVSKSASEQVNKSTTIDYKDKYETLLSNSTHEHSMLLDYARENDSLIIKNEELRIKNENTETTEKRGLNWFQKTQIYGFWVLLVAVAAWVGWKFLVRK